MENRKPCPCGSGKVFDRCCGPFLAGDGEPLNPEQLMRSRYTANVEEDQAYLLDTWHPATRPGTIDGFCHWCGLRIMAIEGGGPGESEGTVEFRAMYNEGEIAGCLHEKSRFIREAGRWYYLDGEIIASGPLTQAKVGRNAPCPCGSGRKYKKCCLRKGL